MTDSLTFPFHGPYVGSLGIEVGLIGLSYTLFLSSVTEFLQIVPPCDDYFPHFSLREVSLGEVKYAIKRSTAQVWSSDGVPQSVIRIVTPVIGSIICIFNGFYHLYFQWIAEDAELPTAWKNSLRVVLSKVSSPRAMGNITPISLLCFFWVLGFWALRP